MYSDVLIEDDQKWIVSNLYQINKLYSFASIEWEMRFENMLSRKVTFLN